MNRHEIIAWILEQSISYADNGTNGIRECIEDLAISAQEEHGCTGSGNSNGFLHQGIY